MLLIYPDIIPDNIAPNIPGYESAKLLIYS